ncbi:hypothetical protein FQN50_008563 [Emmonsiellopsis sp. PD_5]|nr:hypothetical protein FQN50_008563 [Emmonsiellopsis sp. PD_5]
MSAVPLTFGVEIELLLKPESQFAKQAINRYGYNPSITCDSPDKTAQDVNRIAVRRSLADALEIVGVPAGTQSNRQYSKWIVEDEGCLEEIPGYWRCEIISRVLSTEDENNEWQDEIDLLFNAISGNYRIELTTGCSTHIHITPYPSLPYTVEQLRRVMKGVAYYDSALTGIMPADRKDNPYCRPNTQAITHWRVAVSKVPQDTWGPFFRILDRKTSIGALLLDVLDDRSYSWNFSRVVDECGTIEFRRAPGVRTGTTAKHWVAVALGFIANAMELQDWSTEKYIS